MAETFHRFRDLPTELRLQIWEQTMFEARPDRRIIVYEGRVVPFKQFISPLLLVNYESRTCAQAFYNVTLDIYAVPRLSESQLEFLDKEKKWARIPGSDKAVDGKIHGYTDEWTQHYFQFLRNGTNRGEFYGEFFDIGLFNSPRLQKEEHQRISREEKEYTVNLEEHWSEYVEEQLRVLGWESAVEAEKSGPKRGLFYISPEHDVFIDGHECGSHFHIENASTIFKANLIEPQRPACHHISAMLTAATRERISTLVLVRPREIKDGWHCVFADGRHFQYDDHPLNFACRARRNWNQETFPCVRSYFRLRPDCYNRPDFLKQLIGADGPQLSRILEQWVRYESVDRSGQTVFALKWTKGHGRYNEKADWVRDLMAHWNDAKEDSVRELLADCNISK